MVLTPLPRCRGPRELLIRSARQGSDEVLVTVRDSGVGLAPRELERIFEPFFTTKKQGMGMGLVDQPNDHPRP